MKKQQVDQELQHDTILKLKKTIHVQTTFLFLMYVHFQGQILTTLYGYLLGGGRGRRQVMGSKRKEKIKIKTKEGEVLNRPILTLCHKRNGQ